MTKEQYKNLSRRIDEGLLLQISMMFEPDEEVENTKAHIEEERQEFLHLKARFEKDLLEKHGVTIQFQ